MDALQERAGNFSKVFLRMKLLLGRRPRFIRRVHCGDGATFAKEWSAFHQCASVSDLPVGLVAAGFRLSDIVFFDKEYDKCIVVMVYSKTSAYDLTLGVRTEMMWLLNRVWGEVVVCRGENDTLHFLMTGPDDSDEAVPDIIFKCEDGNLYSTWNAGTSVAGMATS